MITIERTTENGYTESTHEIKDAVLILNQELENSRTLWIDGKPFGEETILEEDLKKCKKSVCVTNRLIGG
jgi:hypothetical protein